MRKTRYDMGGGVTYFTNEPSGFRPYNVPSTIALFYGNSETLFNISVMQFTLADRFYYKRIL